MNVYVFFVYLFFMRLCLYSYILTVLYSYIHYYTYKIQKENVKSIVIVYDFISVNQRKSINKNSCKSEHLYLEI